MENVYISIHLHTFYFLNICSWNFIITNTPSKCSSLASYTALCVSSGCGWIFCFLPFILCCIRANIWGRGSNSCVFFLFFEVKFIQLYANLRILWFSGCTFGKANEKWVRNFRKYNLHDQNFSFVLAGRRKWNRATLVTVRIFGQPACL